MTKDGLRDNSLLAALPAGEFERLAPMLRMADVPVRQQVYRPREPIREVYFPLSAVFSMVAVAGDRVAVEVGTVGFEGMVGLPLFLGASTSPNAAFCQIPGEAAWMSSADFAGFLAVDGSLHRLLHRYVQSTMIQLAQNVVCNSAHALEQRMSRWLLMCADRVRADTFELTQEFLAQMLGVRRATVSETARRLQADGLIRYTRGVMTINDRKRLEHAACECYDILRLEFDQLSQTRPATADRARPRRSQDLRSDDRRDQGWSVD
ncbi:MAG TPA: Crp/Fnr family transcriptional regulator [Actinoplanes sp.]|nr:Crp/Fnr family transcriptional regulator [Actinoplanes sp.]